MLASHELLQPSDPYEPKPQTLNLGYCPHPVTLYIRGPEPYYAYSPTVTDGGQYPTFNPMPNPKTYRRLGYPDPGHLNTQGHAGPNAGGVGCRVYCFRGSEVTLEIDARKSYCMKCVVLIMEMNAVLQ